MQTTFRSASWVSLAVGSYWLSALSALAVAPVFPPAESTLLDDGGVRFHDSDPATTAWLRSEPLPLDSGVDRVALSFEARAPDAAPGASFVVALAFEDATGEWLSGHNLEVHALSGAAWEPWSTIWHQIPSEATAVRVVVGVAPQSPIGTLDLRDIDVRSESAPPTSQGRRIAGAPFELWADWPEQPIYPHLQAPAPDGSSGAASPLRLKAVRGESEAFQLAMRGECALQDLRLEWTAIPAGADPPRVQWRLVALAQAEQPSDGASVSGPFPDALEPFAPAVGGPLAVDANTSRALWVDVQVPTTQAPGTYRATLWAEFSGAGALPIDWQVDVSPAALPAQPALDFSVGLAPQHLARFHDVEHDYEARQRVFEHYLRHVAASRLSVLDAAEEAPLFPYSVQWAWTGGRIEETATERSLGVCSPAGTTGEGTARTAVPVLLQGAEDLWLSVRARANEPASWRLRLQWRDEWGHPVGEWSTEHTSHGPWQQHAYSLAGSGRPADATGVAVFLEALDGCTVFDDVSVRREHAEGDELAPNVGFDLGPLDAPVSLYADDFDAWAALALDELRMPWLRLWVPGAPHGHGGVYIPGNALGYAEGTPRYVEALKAVGAAMHAHLVARGWQDRAYLYPFDEPTPSMIDHVASALNQLGVALPGLPRLLTHAPEGALDGQVDWWMPVWSDWTPELVRTHQAAGERVGSYVSCCLEPWAPNLLADRHPMQARALPFLAWRAGLDSLLYWSAVHWDSALTGPPAQDPWTDPATILASGEWVGNGDGRLLYPPRTPAWGAAEPLAAPIETHRWQMLRQSIEDLDRLALVMAAHPSAVAAAAQAHGWGVSLAEDRGVPAALFGGRAFVTDDLRALHSWRAALWDALADTDPDPDPDAAAAFEPPAASGGDDADAPVNARAGSPGAPPGTPESHSLAPHAPTQGGGGCRHAGGRAGLGAVLGFAWLLLGFARRSAWRVGPSGGAVARRRRGAEDACRPHAGDMPCRRPTEL